MDKAAEVAPADRFCAALRGENRGRPPVWLMRQAGRYLAEYRALKAKYTFKEMCELPAVAVEVSRLPVQLFDVDAIIVFSDILLPLEKMGAPLTYGEGGPRFTRPVRDEEGLAGLRALEAADHGAILESLRRLRAEFDGRKALLGFAGAPFTLASYLVAGRPGDGAETLRQLLFARPGFVHRLLERLAAMTVDYLAEQLRAGADAVQLFDTWAGTLAPREYREFALPYQRDIFRALRRDFGERARTVLYVRDAAPLLAEMAAAEADGLSVDWRVSLAAARVAAGPRRMIQGNLDPHALFAPPERVRALVTEVLEATRGDPGFVFNLGHGVHKDTPVEAVRVLVETVKSFEP